MSKKHIRVIAMMAIVAIVVVIVAMGTGMVKRGEPAEATLQESVAASVTESQEKSHEEHIAANEGASGEERIVEIIVEREEESPEESASASIAESVAASEEESREESAEASIAESIAASEEESREERAAASIAASEEESREESAEASIAESVAASEEASRQAEEQLQQQLQSENGKTIYLTFDDGPSYLTENVLDILDTYGVKATFFVTYQPDYVEQYREIVSRGHAIGIHTSTHAYDQIYASYDNWLADFTKTYDYVYQVTGVCAQAYRFPGGSCGSHCKANTELRDQAINYLHSLGIEYFDWNASSGDGSTVTADQVYNNVIDTAIPRTIPVVLMHDGVNKETTIQALPLIIQELQSRGYSFGNLGTDVAPIQQGIHWDY